jgi:hypothetical protein
LRRKIAKRGSKGNGTQRNMLDGLSELSQKLEVTGGNLMTQEDFISSSGNKN